jgi:hypothetical protein
VGAVNHRPTNLLWPFWLGTWVLGGGERVTPASSSLVLDGLLPSSPYLVWEGSMQVKN